MKGDPTESVKFGELVGTGTTRLEVDVTRAMMNSSLIVGGGSRDNFRSPEVFSAQYEKRASSESDEPHDEEPPDGLPATDSAMSARFPRGAAALLVVPGPQGTGGQRVPAKRKVFITSVVTDAEKCSKVHDALITVPDMAARSAHRALPECMGAASGHVSYVRTYTYMRALGAKKHAGWTTNPMDG
eukprot:CAMPEP_0206290928 /NCGR_PEP_ID=MMETSP0106_2-20121207/2867_1 /ASSEMBLY_ACC=CAM_ASM_000206 /TAXON_ID=81532 /ORGANISM="Acanthoeca-like sp., Strain 10tr" /LENGTH=185 /DNA_ID=CAMNT_0053721493 /DNA_START=264 /DNA_END=818 /DNA_ORIENTATION=-